MTSTFNQGPPPPEAPKANLSSNDPYAVLGLQRGASLHQIKRAYFALVREYPPETEPTAFKTIRAAYEKLRTADTKTETDLFLFRPPADWQPRKRQRKFDLDVHPSDIYHYLQQQGDLGRSDFPEDYQSVRL